MEREKRGSQDAGDQCRELSAGVRAWRGVLMTSGRGALASVKKSCTFRFLADDVISSRQGQSAPRARLLLAPDARG